MRPSLDSLVASTRELMALPATALRLLELMDDATVGADPILKIIERDPSLTANLLKLCNSAYYGLRRQVGSVRESLVLLGNQTVVSLAFATSMGQVMRGPLQAYGLDRGELWRHAACTALGAASLAARLELPVSRERAFTAGLVHDIGKLMLDRPLVEQLEGPLADDSYAILVAAEKDHLGFDHAEAGAALAAAWNFPDELVGVIRHHHTCTPGPGPLDLAQVVVLADYLACSLGHVGGTAPLAADKLEAVLKPWDLEPTIVAAVLADLPQEMEALLGAVHED